MRILYAVLQTVWQWGKRFMSQRQTIRDPQSGEYVANAIDALADNQELLFQRLPSGSGTTLSIPNGQLLIGTGTGVTGLPATPNGAILYSLNGRWVLLNPGTRDQVLTRTASGYAWRTPAAVTATTGLTLAQYLKAGGY